ncbi:hypothetical protein DFS34DRAFT_669475 [Phlyctochytrium arcticum]|nr:hypothetical protein DFS34DRAFT_669475 [Phlyctochytrium arcticum]
MYFKTSYLNTSKKFPVETFDWTVNQYLENHEKYPHLVDFFAKSNSIETKKIRPFIDFDMSFKSKEALPSDDEELQIREALKEIFRSLFLNTNIKILAAYREKGFATNKKRDNQSGEYIEHGKYKISYRLYANNVFTSRQDLSKHLKGFMPDLSTFPECARNYSFDNDSLFDTGVYCDNNRSMACVGKTKSKTIMNEPLENYLIQNVQPDDEPVKWSQHTAFNTKKKSIVNVPKATMKRVHEDDEDSDFVHVESDDPMQKKAKVACPETVDSEKCPQIVQDEVIKLIVESFNIRKSDLGDTSLLEHAFVTYIKAPYYCLHTKCEHSESNPKMYISVSRKKVKYQCDVCDKSFVKTHDNTIIADHFPENVKALVQPGEELDLRKARKIMEKQGREMLIHYLNHYFAKVTHEDAICSGEKYFLESS